MSETIDGRGEFVKAGYLVKSPPLSRAYVSQWHRRWFLLMDSRLVYPLAERYVRLVYYQSEADAKRLADPKGSINLNSCLSVLSSTVPIKNYKFVFDVSTNERIYHLAADSEEERLEWVSVLKELLFPSQKNGAKPRPPPVPAQCDSPEIIARRSRDSARMPRPNSLAAAISTENKGSRVQQRPLPPVPGGVISTSVPSSPVERKKRPLPATPVSCSAGICVHPIGPQTSPLLVQRKKTAPPPPKPSPYRKNNSEPSPPPSVFTIASPSFPPHRSASLSPPPSVLLAEDYQEFVSQSQPECAIDNCEYGVEMNTVEDNYSLATSVPREHTNSSDAKVSPCNNEDYSVLESTVVSGYDPADQDYSHLEAVMNDSPPPPIRYSSLATHLHNARHKPKSSTRPHSAIPDYVNCPSPSDDDYSRLDHLHH